MIINTSSHIDREDLSRSALLIGNYNRDQREDHQRNEEIIPCFQFVKFHFIWSYDDLIILPFFDGSLQSLHSLNHNTQNRQNLFISYSHKIDFVENCIYGSRDFIASRLLNLKNNYSLFYHTLSGLNDFMTLTFEDYRQNYN